MPLHKWTVVALALCQGVWLIFDGSRALITGDYATPTAGPRAGQLGPWSHLVTALGVNPRSALMKCVHVVLGTAWLAGVALFDLKTSAGGWLLLGCAIATLWYLPLGTMFSLIVIALLLTGALRALA
jgi:hypothetical protein